MSKELAAFFKAGYSYDDAVLLSRLWGQATAYDAKVWAGDKLLNHIPVPIKPGQTAWTVSDDVALQAYFGNGYDYADAQKFAKLWNTANLSDAKVTAGHKLLAGLELPEVAEPAPQPSSQQQIDAFFKAGYSYDDAVLLSRLWGQATAYDAKVWAGDKLLNHIPVPIKPGQTAWTVSDDVALQAYFGNGYDYADAQKFAKLWNTANLSDAKVTAGHKLLAGLPLPLN